MARDAPESLCIGTIAKDECIFRCAELDAHRIRIVEVGQTPDTPALNTLRKERRLAVACVLATIARIACWHPIRGCKGVRQRQLSVDVHFTLAGASLSWRHVHRGVGGLERLVARSLRTVSLAALH